MAFQFIIYHLCLNISKESFFQNDGAVFTDSVLYAYNDSVISKIIFPNIYFQTDPLSAKSLS